MEKEKNQEADLKQETNQAKDFDKFAEILSEGLDRELDKELLAAQCKEFICPSCDVEKKAEDIRLRALAEVENVKRRLDREADDIRKYASEKVLADLLPILDNLDLALQYSSSVADSCKNFVLGVDMTRKMFLDVIAQNGLVAIGAEGEEFDPTIHEAVGTDAASSHPENHVVQIVQRGYNLKGRVLRPAKVVVKKS